MRRTLSTSDVGRLMGVAAGSVAVWIDQGKLKAGRTPGGHRRIEVPDLVEFLKKQQLAIPAELNTAAIPRILVVDDEELVASWVAAEVLAAHPDFEVRKALSGFEAGELVNALKPDVVFLDLRMPGMDGFEVCRHIKGREATRHAEVIAMTAHHTPRAETEILECGARACLSKPLKRPGLMDALDTALTHRFGPSSVPGATWSRI